MYLVNGAAAVPATDDHFVIAAFVIAGVLVLGIGTVQFILRRRSTDRMPNLATNDSQKPGRQSRAVPSPVRTEPPVLDRPRPERRAGTLAVRPGPALAPLGPVEPNADPEPPVSRICTGFCTWLSECEDLPDLWTSFDQVLRELLTEHLGASRVRCYHIRPGCDTLQTISQATNRTRPVLAGSVAEQGPSLHAGVLGHAATTGREFVANDPFHGPLLDHLAAQSGEGWAWVWPVRGHEATCGVVAVANLQDASVLTPAVRQTVGQLVSLCWHHVACLERLRVVQRTDQASGVLTRSDFFTLAQHALADSYRVNEPVVVAVLALEGLRGLDDMGRWRERDALIERIGHLIARRARTDDLVGRFADDRFVVLLRRLDVGLGRLVADKMVATANECIAQLVSAVGAAADSHRAAGDSPPSLVRLRTAVAGSGLAAPPLDELLVAAFAAVEKARKENRTIPTVRAGLSAARPTPEVERTPPVTAGPPLADPPKAEG